jgi:cytochrome c-type biogenesis protein CcmH
MTPRTENALFRRPWALCLISLLGAVLLHAQSSERAKQLGEGMLCMCNCNQILTQCNHVGCPVSGEMLKKLDQRVAGNASDDLILQSFVQEYGPRVLASPPAQGFNLVAWIIPGLSFAVGLAIVILVIRNWRQRLEPLPAAGPAVSPDVLERARQQADRETED